MDSFFKENNIFVKDYSEILEIEHTHYLEMFYDNQYEDKEYSFHEFVHFDEIKKHRTEYAIEQNEKKSYGMKEVETTPKAMDAYIAKTMLHQQNIRLSRVAIKDMFSFLYKIGGIYENYSERQDGSKINRKNIEVA